MLPLPQNIKIKAGSTATVLLVTPSYFICANAGDARTVLCRNKEAINLSEDHKPSNPDELARIEAADGFVFNNRVNN